ncbi:MAG TPA: HIT domain-containing protein [Dehalococcoidia bacterium]
MTQQDCLSCDVIAGRRETPGGVIFEGELWHLTHQVSPVRLPGFLILQPKRHVEQIGDLTEEEAATMGPVMAAASQALNLHLQARKVYVCSFGSVLVHVHFYLVPVTAAIPQDLNGADLLDEVFAGRWACDDAEAADAAARVRVELAKNLYL